MYPLRLFYVFHSLWILYYVQTLCTTDFLYMLFKFLALDINHWLYNMIKVYEYIPFYS